METVKCPNCGKEIVIIYEKSSMNVLIVDNDGVKSK